MSSTARPAVAFEGSADPLVKAIARTRCASIRSRDDDLEEIFLRYYRDAETREHPGLRDGPAPADPPTLLAALGMALVILMVGALFPAVGDSIGKLDLPEGRDRAARRRRLRDDHRLDAQRDRRGVRAARGRGHARSPPRPRSTAGEEEDGILGADARAPDRALAAVLAKAAAVAVSVGVVALGTFVGLIAGVAVGGGGIALGHLAALALHLAFFGFAVGALALALAASTGRRASRRRRRRGVRRARLPDQRLRATRRRAATG